jgi:type III secretion protein R
LAGGDEAAIDGPDTLSYTFSYVVPAYLADELTKAFQVGLLIYLCFAMVDLIVGIILVAIGMQAMSPVVISTPLKLLLFIAVEGWTRLLQNLILAG